ELRVVTEAALGLEKAVDHVCAVDLLDRRLPTGTVECQQEQAHSWASSTSSKGSGGVTYGRPRSAFRYSSLSAGGHSNHSAGPRPCLRSLSQRRVEGFDDLRPGVLPPGADLYLRDPALELDDDVNRP